MQITPKAGPAAPVTAAPGPSEFSKQQAVRARAIAAYTGNPAATTGQETAVQNPNSISPEEMGAIKTHTNQETSRQNDTIVDETTPLAIPEPNVSETAKPVEDPTLSRKFAQLAKQERASRMKLQQSEQAIKAKEADMVAREAALAAKEQEYRQGWIPKSQIKSNPLQVLTDAEVSYDELTQQMLATPTQTDPKVLAHIAKLEAKLQSLEEASVKSEQTYKTNQQQAYDSALKQIRLDVDHLVKTDPNLETVRETKSNKDVVDLIVKTFEQDGVLLTAEEAAIEVENHILEEAVKLSRLSKVSKRAQAVERPAVPSKPPTTTAQSGKPTQPQMRTLTNAAASTRPMNARERAIAAFKGELK